MEVYSKRLSYESRLVYNSVHELPDIYKNDGNFVAVKNLSMKLLIYTGV